MYPSDTLAINFHFSGTDAGFIHCHGGEYNYLRIGQWEKHHDTWIINLLPEYTETGRPVRVDFPASGGSDIRNSEAVKSWLYSVVKAKPPGETPEPGVPPAPQ